ncbi:C40 family peptidase [Streptomyces sp. Ru73]|uniref:C40 family peptidase n=1 Tax=Streptomyces sp. Ru73 TaxID=2080748 RepID=UPI0021565C5D|nr:C40 family peptidase [Streptomyces sp. Ru73]
MERRNVGRGAVVACAAAVLCATGGLALPAPAYADPAPAGGRDLEAVRKKIDDLYRRAERATDAYNAAEERVKRQQKEIVKLAKNIVSTQEERKELKRRAGSLASAQYRGGGLPAEAQLMLNKDPEGFLDNATLARKGQHAVRTVLGQLARTESDLQDYAKDATDRWDRLEKERKKKAAAKKDIEKKIDAAERIESRLKAEEKARLKKLEEDRAQREQAKWLDSGILQEIGGTASAQGKKAISYATAQIGKDYVWGAEGPDTFDCSGLTMRAWQAAGRTIPRTSQEQWKQLPHIDVEDMRPGDLIIYHEDASHVGMYLGDGAIVHAPRPGRQVTIAGAGSMRILGVVRPDAGR